MPSDAFEDNREDIIDWNTHNLLPNPNQEGWYPAVSAVDSSFIVNSSNYEFQPQFMSVSAVDPSLDPGAGRAEDAYLNDHKHNFNSDVHQGQHWSDLPSQQHAVPAPAAARLSGTGIGRTDSTVDEASLAKDLGQANLRKVKVSAAISQPRAITPLAKPHGSESTNPLRVNSQHREAPSLTPLSSHVSISSGSGYRPVNAARGSDRRKPPSTPKSNPLARNLSMDVAEARGEEDPRKGQIGLVGRGGSVVSSASGQSRGENPFPRSDVQDEEVSSTTARSENKGAGRTPGVLRTRTGLESDDGQYALPHAKGFSIQIGSDVFKISGASIMSDG